MRIETEKIKKDEMNHEGFIEETFYKLFPEHDMDLIYIGQIIERSKSHEIKAEPNSGTEARFTIEWVKIRECDLLKRMVSAYV